MKTTKELEKSIKKKIRSKIICAEFIGIHFADGSSNNREGIYIYVEGDKYIYMYSERGKTTLRKELSSETEVLWEVLGSVARERASSLYQLLAKKDTDYRKFIFNVEIKIFSRFGEDFKNRKIEEIENILLKYPD